jgi:hypothetical protein
MRANFRPSLLVFLGLAPLLVSVPACSGNQGPTLPACTTPDYLVAMRSDGPRPNSYVPFQLDGDTLYYTDGSAIFTVANGEPTQAGAGPAGEPFGPTVSAFWVEPTRFVIASPDAVWSTPRDGSPATRIATLPGNFLGTAFGRDASNVYVAATGPSTEHFFRVPLTGGAPTDLGTAPAGMVRGPLYVGATQVYARLSDNTDTVVAVAKDGSGVTPVALDRPNGGGYFVLGFDGDAFFVAPQSKPGVSEVDRVTPDGTRETAWIDGDLSLDIGPESVAAAPDAAYVVGTLHAGRSIPVPSVVRLARDGSRAGVVACDSNADVFYTNPAVGAQSVYAQVSQVYGSATSWGIARFAR